VLSETSTRRRPHGRQSVTQAGCHYPSFFPDGARMSLATRFLFVSVIAGVAALTCAMQVAVPWVLIRIADGIDRTLSIL